MIGAMFLHRISKKLIKEEKNTNWPIVGQLADISITNVLPTKLYMLQYFEWVRNQQKSKECYQPEKKN